MNWLLGAYEAAKPGNAAAYNMGTGWSAPYPETTGYIIETFFDYIRYLHKIADPDTQTEIYHTAAVEMADWLLSIQYENGGFPGGLFDGKEKPLNVFNTGQILLGLLRCYKETNNKKYLYAAVKAGEWLLSVQNHDGTWSNYTYENDPRSYHARVSWPLLLLSSVTHDTKYKQAAVTNLQWVLTNQKLNFWFEKTNFFDETTSLTHTLAYTLRGLLEAGIMLKDDAYITAVKNTADTLLQIHEHGSNHLLPAVFDETWKSVSKYSCLTGCAQISIIWLKFYELTEDTKYLTAGLNLNSALKKTQMLGNYPDAINGAIKGSHPIYGAYMPFSFPNWATKFYVDALLLEDIVLHPPQSKKGGSHHVV
jgi:uncharacterized protein YyaL (SSP411 family)